MVGRRLHPAGIAVLALAALRGAALPLLVALLVTGGADRIGRSLGLALLGALAAGAIGYVTWRTKLYWVTATAIKARQGVFTTRETVVPLDRVQSLDTVQGPVQRLFGVTAVHVQAAGGGQQGEIVLEALAPAAVAELRAAVGRERPSALPEGDVRPPGAVHRLSGARLAVAAVTSGQLGVIAPVLAGASQVADDVVGRGGRPGEAFDLLPDTVAELGLAVAALLALAWLLSIAGAVVAFAGFTLTRQDDRLLIRRGLLARREASVPLARIQAVTVVEGILRQPFGLAALRVEVAGYAGEAGVARVLFPLLRTADVEPFLSSIAPGSELAIGPGDRAGALTPPPRRAARRYALPPALAGAALGAGLAFVPGLGAWTLALALPGALLGLAAHRAAGYRLEPARIAIRSRRLARRTVLVPRRRLQEHAVSQSPLQRRGALATFSLAAGAGTRAAVAHLEAPRAQELFSALR